MKPLSLINTQNAVTATEVTMGAKTAIRWEARKRMLEKEWRRRQVNKLELQLAIPEEEMTTQPWTDRPLLHHFNGKMLDIPPSQGIFRQ